MLWDDEDDYDEEEQAFLRFWQHPWYDPQASGWRCDCRRFLRAGSCPHLRWYRRTVIVDVLERYL